jgi:endonuclease-8
MPEGDTILRAARALSRVLAGQTILRVSSPLPGLSRTLLAGARVTTVDAVGKNLLVRFDDGRVLHTHLRMEGSWHVYRVGERWRRAASRARIVLETAAHVAVCFDAPIVRLVSAARARRDMAKIGPDLLAPDFDAGVALARLRAAPGLAVGDAILRQSLVAGVGNVCKSEVLFLARVDPRANVAELSDASLATILAEARRLLAINSAPNAGAMRRTRGGRHPLWVYRRKGEPCFRCRTPIQMVRQGPTLRSTYFCPACQVFSRS